MVQKQLLTSDNDHWMTDPDFLEVLYKFGPIALDPCFHPESFVKAANVFIYPDKDGLAEPWSPYNGLVYVNPPYGRQIIKWVKKCLLEASKGTEIILLIPARVDTKAFQDFIFPSCQKICFVKGRLKFVDARDPKGKKNPSTFPSAAIYFGPNPEKFEEIFSEIGRVFTCRLDTKI